MKWTNTVNFVKKGPGMEGELPRGEEKKLKHFPINAS